MRRGSRVRTAFAACAIACLAALGIAGWILAGQSAAATPADIEAALEASPPGCRQIARERLRVAIARPGYLSRRALAAATGRECATAAAQLAAVERDRADDAEVTEIP